jgi:hypothetical protein
MVDAWVSKTHELKTREGSSPSLGTRTVFFFVTLLLFLFVIHESVGFENRVCLFKI